MRRTNRTAIALSAVAGALTLTAILYQGGPPESTHDHLERAVLNDLPLGKVTNVRFGPHRIGSNSAVLRVRYKLDGVERDELHQVQDGEPILFWENRRGDAWQDRR